jgi:TPR repeat protein
VLCLPCPAYRNSSFQITLAATGKGLTVNGIDRAEKVLRSALGGSSLTDLLSQVPHTHPKCSGIDGKEIECSAIPMDSIGDRSSSLENGKGTVARQGRDLYWHDYYASLESDGLWTEYLNDLRPSPADIDTNTDTGTGTEESAVSEQLHRRSLLADLVETDLLKRPESSRDDPRSKSWVVNYREPSGFGGESGRLTDQEFSVVTESIRSMAESTNSSALPAVPTDRTIHTHGTHHGPVGGQERVREDNLLSSMHYFPAARHVDAHRLSQLPTTGMQVVHELIHIWREEEGEYYSHGGGTWPGAAAQMGEPGSAQRKAEDDFFQEYAGEKKEDRYQRKKAEATDGNVHSQMWMGKKIFSDNNGNDGIVSKARVWFEKAAAQNDPEANYIVGVLSVNNLGGLRRDFSKEVGLFLKAAHATEPFPMAWHALGDLHNGMPHSKDNIDADRLKAVEYYSRAAEYDFHESHFQLALMYKEGSKFIPVNIPRTVVHLTLAASLGSTKALSYLAHAFYDQNSWVMKYAREMAAKQLHTRSYPHTESTESQYSRRPIEKDYITSVYESFTSGEWTSMFQGTGVEVAIRLRDQLHRLGTFLFQEFMGPDPPPPSRFLAQHIMHDAALSAKIRHGWVYNTSTPLFVTLPGILSPILVPLPHPFWAPNSPPHHMLSARVRDSPSLKDCNSCRGPDSSSENTENTCQCDIGEKEKEEQKVYANDVTAAEFSMALLKHTVELSDSPMDLMVSADTSTHA